MAEGVKGGYTKVVFGTTVGLTTSTQIGGTLLNGTRIGDGEAVNEADASGKDISTGHRSTSEVHTTQVTGSVRTTLDGYESNCTDTYWRFYATGNKPIVIGPVRVSIADRGADAGSLHRTVYSLSAFEAQSKDIVRY